MFICYIVTSSLLLNYIISPHYTFHTIFTEHTHDIQTQEHVQYSAYQEWKRKNRHLHITQLEFFNHLIHINVIILATNFM
jgi:hypothetical protein